MNKCLCGCCQDCNNNFLSGHNFRGKEENNVKWMGGKSAADSRYYLKNKERIIKINKEWAKNNPEKVRKYSRKYRSRNLIKCKMYYEENKEKCHIRVRNYYRRYLSNKLNAARHAAFTYIYRTYGIKKIENPELFENFVKYKQSLLLLRGLFKLKKQK